MREANPTWHAKALEMKAYGATQKEISLALDKSQSIISRVLAKRIYEPKERKPEKPEPTWRQVARDLWKAGIGRAEIARRVGISHGAIRRFFDMDRGPDTFLLDPDMGEAAFIEPHKTRVVRPVFDRNAVRQFIAAGGGAPARERMLRKLGIPMRAAA